MTLELSVGCNRLLKYSAFDSIRIACTSCFRWRRVGACVWCTMLCACLEEVLDLKAFTCEDVTQVTLRVVRRGEYKSSSCVGVQLGSYKSVWI